MIIALFQTTEPGSLEEGLATIDGALGSAKTANVDMLVFPEIYLPGYTQASATPPDNWSNVQDQLSRLCIAHGVALTIGLPQYTGEKVFNTALSIGADGTLLARYCKVQLFGPSEAALYTAGEAYVTFDYAGTRFGLLICYDVEFPEHARALALKGVEVILVPTANMMPFTNVNRLMVPSRAAENGITVVYANYCGEGRGLTYSGLSVIAGPDGSTLAAMDQDSGLCIAPLPTSEASAQDIPHSTQIADYKAI